MLHTGRHLAATGSPLRVVVSALLLRENHNHKEGGANSQRKSATSF